MKNVQHWRSRNHNLRDEKEVYRLYMEAYVRLEKAKRIVEEIGWAWEYGKLQCVMGCFDLLMDNYLSFKKDLPKYKKNLHECESVGKSK